MDHAKGMLVTRKVITDNPNLMAVFASNDNMRLGAIKALKNAGIVRVQTHVGLGFPVMQIKRATAGSFVK